MSAGDDTGDGGDDPVFSDATVERVRDTLFSGTGYRRPPQDRQFKKGQSGNPNGRPKKPKAASSPVTLTSFDEDVLAEISKLETVMDRGKKVRVPRGQLYLAAQSAAALKGNALAQRTALAMRADFERRAAAQAAIDKERAEKRYELMVSLKASQQKIWDHLLSTKELDGDPYPRPEDILLNELEQTHEIRGPLSTDDLPASVAVLLQRDQALIHWATMSGRDSQDERRLALAWLVFETFNKRLPLAWQLDDVELLTRISHYQSMSDKQLDIERAILSEMEARLQLPQSRKPDTGSDKVDRTMEQWASKAGYASFAVMNDALEGQRISRLTRKIKQVAHERLEAMFTIDVEAERRRVARKADEEARKPLYEQRRLEVK
jgi:hypothetical protein